MSVIGKSKRRPGALFGVATMPIASAVSFAVTFSAICSGMFASCGDLLTAACRGRTFIQKTSGRITSENSPCIWTITLFYFAGIAAEERTTNWRGASVRAPLSLAASFAELHIPCIWNRSNL
jgi:hypothetical protein